MVAVVDLAGERREAHRQERHDLNTLVAHAVEERVADVPATHIVVDESDLNALPRLIDQGIGEQQTKGIFGKDVHIDMDMSLGLGYLSQQRREEGVAIVVDGDLIVLEGE